MKKRILLTIAITAIVTVAITVGALAATGAIEITALLDPGVSIKYDGEAKQLTDANGDPVYPIMYNGTTYVPVRGIAGLFSVAVDWDNDTRSVLLGKKDDTTVPETKDIRLADLTPSSKDVQQNTYVVDFMKDRFGNVYRDCVNIKIHGNNNYIEYFLDKKYSKLTLTVVPEESFYDNLEVTLSIDGDSKNLWTSDPLNYKSRPVTIEIDVTGQEYLRFSDNIWGNSCYIILGNATLS